MHWNLNGNKKNEYRRISRIRHKYSDQKQNSNGLNVKKNPDDVSQVSVTWS